MPDHLYFIALMRATAQSAARVEFGQICEFLYENIGHSNRFFRLFLQQRTVRAANRELSGLTSTLRCVFVFIVVHFSILDKSAHTRAIQAKIYHSIYLLCVCPALHC